MKIKFLSQIDNELRFILKDSNPSYANALRRAMIAEVPTLAIEEVLFRRNSSALYDEMIAHRLGLIPLKADLKNYNFREKCKCKGKGCSRCQASFALKEVGPKMVRAGDLKPRDPAITPIYPEMPVVELLEGQEIELEAIAVLGVGKDHAKFSPCLATYQHFPLIKINPRKCKPEKCNYACISACPKGILIGKEKARIDESKLMECHLCKACEESCPSRAIDVRGNSTKFIFYLESWGQLAPREIVSLAIDKLIEKLKQLNKLLKRVKKKK